VGKENSGINPNKTRKISSTSGAGLLGYTGGGSGGKAKESVFLRIDCNEKTLDENGKGWAKKKTGFKLDYACRGR